MADKTKVGKELPIYTYEVERVKIRELAMAIGDHNPIYYDKTAAIKDGYKDTPCPPTFATLTLQEWTEAYLKAFHELGVKVEDALHGEEEYEYYNEIYPGDLLSAQMKIVNVEEKRGKTGTIYLITLETTYTNQHAEKVMRARSVLIERKKN